MLVHDVRVSAVKYNTINIYKEAGGFLGNIDILSQIREWERADGSVVCYGLSSQMSIANGRAGGQYSSILAT